MILRQTSCIPGTTCSVFPLEKRKVVKKVISGSIAYFFLVVFFGAFALSLKFFIKDDAAFRAMSGVFFFAAIFAAIMIAYVIIREVCYFRDYFYDLKTDEVVIRKGFISRVELSLAYNKIQNVYVDQDVFDRSLGLYDVHLETAGLFSGIHAHIDGVNAENAAKLRDTLMARTKQSSGQPRAGV